MHVCVGGGGFFFFLVYVIGLNDPRPRLDKTGELDSVRLQRAGGEREENQAVKQLDRHLLGVYARPYFQKEGRAGNTVACSLSDCHSSIRSFLPICQKKPRFYSGRRINKVESELLQIFMKHFSPKRMMLPPTCA